MKFFPLLLFVFLFAFGASAQNIETEYRYLALAKTQSHQLIKNNLRNAEITADSILTAKYSNPYTSLFFIELSENYAAVKKYDLALFSLLRQQLFTANNEQSTYVDAQIKRLASFLNTSANPFLEANNSASASRQDAFEKLLLLSASIETKQLTPLMLHTLNIMRMQKLPVSSKLAYWEELSLIKIPVKQKKIFLENSFEQLNAKQKAKYYKHQTRYLIKHNAWNDAETTLNKLRATNNSKKGSCLLALRLFLHL